MKNNWIYDQVCNLIYTRFKRDFNLYFGYKLRLNYAKVYKLYILYNLKPI